MTGVLDGGRCVATFRSYDGEITMPGAGPVTVDAISTVTVLPTHRRRRLLSRMMTADLRRARADGHAFAALIAMEAPIYGRFGFGPATRSTSLTVDADRVRFRPDAPTGGGRLEFLAPDAPWDELAAVHDAARRARAGGLEREDRWWRAAHRRGTGRTLGPRSQVVLHRDAAGRPDGYVAYDVTESWAGRVSTSSVKVLDLTATDPGAYRDLWEFLASIDLVRVLHAADRPVDELLPQLLLDPRAVQTGPVDDFLWMRVLDVPGALAARRYLGCGSLVLRVVDRLGLADATVRLAVEESRCGADGWTCAEITATTDAPDVTLEVAELAALLLGGTSPVALARAGRLQGSAAAVHRLQALLATPEAPYCATWF